MHELGDELPTRFRIFSAGMNETSKGPVLFDKEAAAMVMGQYAKEGVDIMIDLEHQSLDADDRSRPDAPDARGWLKLNVTSEGELWAESVTWTADGKERVLGKKQRYISPVVATDKNDRARYILNVALVAAPATHNAQALIAASKHTSGLSRKVAARLSAAKYLAKVKNSHGS